MAVGGLDGNPECASDLLRLQTPRKQSYDLRFSLRESGRAIDSRRFLPLASAPLPSIGVTGLPATSSPV